MAKFFIVVDSPGSALESSSIHYRRLTYYKCTFVNKNVIVVSAALIDIKDIKELAGKAVYDLWMNELRKDTGVMRCENSRRFRSVLFDPSRKPDTGALDLNLFSNLPFAKYISGANVDIAGMINMDLVTPVLEFIMTVHAAGDKEASQYILVFLTKMVGSRKKMKTALLFVGPKGAGKDIIFEALFSIFYGPYYIKKAGKGVSTSFNSEQKGKVFGLWNEIEVNKDNIQVIKDMLKAIHWVEHGKGVNMKARSCWRSRCHRQCVTFVMSRLLGPGH